NSFTYFEPEMEGKMSPAFYPIHSSLGSMVMYLFILSVLCMAPKSLRVCTKSYMKAVGNKGCWWGAKVWKRLISHKLVCCKWPFEVLSL
uniref:Uncharacterized protein n=1 Tax=Castor canadensis TaxID=51338 RepID=A0A8C0XL50_CASCN